MKSILMLALLGGAVCWAQDPCAPVAQADADALLGGVATKMAVGKMGCSFGVRAKGVRLTLTALDAGKMAQQTFDGMKGKSKASGWLAGEEAGMGEKAYAELIPRSAESAAGKAGFVVVKAGKVIQISVTDSAGKDDIAGKKAMLDQLRPVAKRIVEKL